MAIKQKKTKAVAEFGDFQTPLPLAREAVKVLHDLGIRPCSILEPTCGRGSFVAAAAEFFDEVKAIVGIDINHLHIGAAKAAVAASSVEFREGDFFKFEWDNVLKADQKPWLVLGNPPWVTSAELGSIESQNLPEKSNFQGHTGIAAITGKSNFDISEWMLLRYLDWLKGSAGTIAVLCKTAVARKILLHIWTKKYPIKSARMYKIDALGHFGAAVEACFFVVETEPKGRATSCDLYESLAAKEPRSAIGFSDGHLILDMRTFAVRRSLLGTEERYNWRSGIKHDCSKVMELTPTVGGYLNGLGETVSMEDTFLFPMLKGSDVGNGRATCRGVMLVTQRSVGEATSPIEKVAPQTWEYLKSHAEFLAKRGSVIYKNKPEFSIFGVGTYSFSPWKVAISGFYKNLGFLQLRPVSGKPIVFDDTVNFIACWSEEEADFINDLLNSDAAKEFYGSMIHWDEKRPITVEILRRLSIRKLAAELGRERDYERFTARDASGLPLMAEAIKRDRVATAPPLSAVA